MTTFSDLITQVKSQIREVSAEDTKARVIDKAGDPNVPFVVDVRERDEYEQGFIPGAQWIPRGFLELKIEDAVPERDREIIIYCAGGTRSALAAQSLALLGYEKVSSMAGGFRAWKNAGFSFGRHIMLPEVGETGQGKLIDSKVLFLGAGGLGSPSSLYIAAAGVGTIGIVDDDVVDESNLQRQVLHNMDRLGMPKVESARLTLQGLNPDLKVVP